MNIVYFKEDSVSEEEYSLRDGLRKMHELGQTYLSGALQDKQITTDGDGVLWHDDLALLLLRVISGDDARKMFEDVAKLNVKAVAEQGKPPYCWYAPTVFAGQLLNGLSTEVNRVVGEYARLMPDVEKFVRYMTDLGIAITTVSGAHQEAAEEVSKRCGVARCIGTQLNVAEGNYGDGVKRFIGGEYKLRRVKKILSLDENRKGTHHGDGWSDCETMCSENINGIAFNPSCMPVLKHSPISVIGTSSLALLPFYDIDGKQDNLIAEGDLPEIVVVNPERGWFEETLATHLENQTRLNRPLLLEISKTVKQSGVENRLSPKGGGFEGLVEFIQKELENKSIEYHTRTKEFMSLEEFDRYAKELYEDFTGSEQWEV